MIKLTEGTKVTVIPSIDDIVIVTDTSGKVLRANRIGIDIFGMGEAWLIDQDFDNLVSGIDGSPLSLMGTEVDPHQGNAIRLRFLTHKEGGISAEVRRSSGKWDGKDVLIFVARDISDNLRVERALKESEENFRTFFESISDLIFVGTPEGQMLYCNEAVSRKLGYDSEELLKMHVLDVHPLDKRGEAEAIFAAMFRGERESCPLPLAAKDGKLLPVETRAWFGRWGGRDCIFGISKDITAEQEAQQRFERLFRNNPASMALSSLPDRRFFDVNDAFLKAFGYTKTEVVGKTSNELALFVRPEQQDTVGAHLLAQQRIVDQELQARRKNGEIVEGLFSGELINNQGRQYFLTVMVDITERKRIEEELKRLTDRLSLATRAGGVGVWDMDVVKNELNWDDQMFNLYGIRREDFCGAYEAWGACLVPEDKQRGELEIAMALRGEKEFDTEFRVLWPDGSVRNIRALALVQRDAQGNPLRMVGTNWDITERKMVEEEAQYQSTMLNSLLDSIPDIVFFKDLDGVYLGCNPPFAAFVGRTQQEIIGKTDYDLFSPEVADSFREYDWNMLQERHSRRNDEWITYPDGKRKLIETLKTPYWGPSGKLVGILGISRDITEKAKRTEDVN